jgi:hypothetical protein
LNESQQPPSPAPGSHRYFAWLYAPASLREELSTLFALADEIGTDPAIDADHSVAHARLEWWRHEAERFSRGLPQHPWLRSLLRDHPQASSLDLQLLVDGAEQDLATRTLKRGDSESLRRAMFALAAWTLCEHHPTPAITAAAGDIGAATQKLERDPDDAIARAALPSSLLAIGHGNQPSLTPLLVWLALAAMTPRQRGPLFRVVFDNFVAWSAARRAARGRFRLDA